MENFNNCINNTDRDKDGLCAAGLSHCEESCPHYIKADEPTPEQREMALYEGAVGKWGEKAQILMAVEEMSELTKALLKYLRFKDFGHGSEDEVIGSVAEERADVSIMLNQLEVIFGDNSEKECEKLEHLAELLK